MWCPKCKNEYVPGITQCVDCNVALVNDLSDTVQDDDIKPQAANSDGVFADLEAAMPELQEALANQLSNMEATDEQPKEPITPAHAYISKRAKKDDVKSTAYSFTLISIVGIIFLILFLTDTLPVYTAGYMKVLIGIVMGGMFTIFLIVGLRSFKQIKQLEKEADSEDDSYEKITEWFHSTYTASDIDAELNTEQPEEMLYFSRYEVMSRLIRENHGNLEESFLDHIIENLYAEIF